MFEVWSIAGCKWCTNVCELLTEHGIPFEERTPSVSELRATARLWAFTTVPQVFDDEGDLIGGYTETLELLSKK